MLKEDFDEALLQEALRQTLRETVATKFHDHAVNPCRNLLSTSFLSSHQPAPSFPLGLSDLTPLPFSIPMPAASLQGFKGLTLLPGPATYGSRSAPWKDSDDFLLAAVESERRRLGDLRSALIGKHNMATHEEQTRQALLTHILMQQDQQQQHKGSYLSQPMQTVTSQVFASLTAPSSTVYTGNKFCQADTPADSAKVFKVLGSSLRGKTDRYIDISELPVIAEQEHQTIRGGVAVPFPEKLYFMLQDVEKQGKSNIISFCPHGRAFAIHDMKAFTDEILPKYFAKQGKLVSFVRQINLYGFARIHSGPDACGYYHELFLKDRPDLLTFMRRAGASKGKDDRRKRKDRHLPVLQPDFYAMKPIRSGL